MKFSLALVTILSMVSATAAVSLDQREPAKKELVELPIIDLMTLGDDESCRDVGDDDIDMMEERSEDGLTVRKACPPCYPYTCLGKCCRFNKCCRRECCLPIADFCSTDGRCKIRC